MFDGFRQRPRCYLMTINSAFNCYPAMALAVEMERARAVEGSGGSSASRSDPGLFGMKMACKTRASFVFS